MYERGESLQPKRRPSPNELVRQTALLPPQMQRSVCPAARAMGLPKSTVHDHLGRTLQGLQHVQAVGDTNWSSDAEDKEARYLGIGNESMDMAPITNDRLAKIIADNHQQGSRVRLIVVEAKAKEEKNLKWLRAFKRAGIPIRSGRTASQVNHTEWSVLDGVNGPFVLGGTGNLSVDAFLPAHIETFWTRTSQADIDFHKQLFEELWACGRVLTWTTSGCAFVNLHDVSTEASEEENDRNNVEDEIAANGSSHSSVEVVAPSFTYGGCSNPRCAKIEGGFYTLCRDTQHMGVVDDAL